MIADVANACVIVRHPDPRLDIAAVIVTARNNGRVVNLDEAIVLVVFFGGGAEGFGVGGFDDRLLQRRMGRNVELIPLEGVQTANLVVHRVPSGFPVVGHFTAPIFVPIAFDERVHVGVKGGAAELIDIGRLERAVEIVAQLSIMDPIYLPIFARVDAELETARAAANPIARARALMQSRGAA